MNRFNKYFSFLILCIIPVLTNAQQVMKSMTDTAAFINSLAQFSRSTQTIQGEFVQEKKLKMLNDKVVSKGSLYFKKENKLRWEYTEPFSYIISLNNGKVMLKDEGKVSSYDANANKLFLELNDILITCINGNIFKSKKFSFRFFETEKNNIAEMTPVNSAMKKFIDKIILYFDKTDFTVTKVDMLEPSQNSTVILFKNKKLNGDIAEKYFILN
ncbi:MAG: outer membrane lipoprotein carrier protein LolA [Bacteroidetes bacterium]|nr:outer membrane lipoprotein carrier protein LolA [Bacteroidota bacterium]